DEKTAPVLGRLPHLLAVHVLAGGFLIHDLVVERRRYVIDAEVLTSREVDVPWAALLAIAERRAERKDAGRRSQVRLGFDGPAPGGVSRERRPPGHAALADDGVLGLRDRSPFAFGATLEHLQGRRFGFEGFGDDENEAFGLAKRLVLLARSSKQAGSQKRYEQKRDRAHVPSPDLLERSLSGSVQAKQKAC